MIKNKGSVWIILNKAHWKSHFTEPLNYWRTVLEDSYFTKNVNLQPEKWNISELLLQPKTLHPVFSNLKEVFGAVAVANLQMKMQTKCSNIFSRQFTTLILKFRLICFISLLWSVLAVSVCFSGSLVKLQQVGSHENRVLTPWSQTTLSTHKSHCRLLKDYNRNALAHELE